MPVSIGTNRRVPGHPKMEFICHLTETITASFWATGGSWSKIPHLERSFPPSSSFRKEMQWNSCLDSLWTLIPGWLGTGPISTLSSLAKNQLVKDWLQSISPLVIPALKHNQDFQDTHILLCPVRALRCYLDRTRDSRGGRQLLSIFFIFFSTTWR